MNPKKTAKVWRVWVSNPCLQTISTLAALIPAPEAEPSPQTLHRCIRCLFFPQHPPRSPLKEVIQPPPTQDEPPEKSETSRNYATYSSSIRRSSPRTVSFRVRAKASGRKTPVRAVKDEGRDDLVSMPCWQSLFQNVRLKSILGLGIAALLQSSLPFPSCQTKGGSWTSPCSYTLCWCGNLWEVVRQQGACCPQISQRVTEMIIHPLAFLFFSENAGGKNNPSSFSFLVISLRISPFLACPTFKKKKKKNSS